MHRSPDKSNSGFAANVDLSKDVMLSSWGKVEMYKLDFGLGLGLAEAVRRPLFDTVESLMYLMPKKLDGEIALAICLRDEDMERLRADKELREYAEFVG